jgi:sulfide:quinone oxidoreductase
MAKLLILGAGVAGQTAALHARRQLGKNHEVIVVAPNSNYNWIPSNIWVGIGAMKKEQVIFPLAPVFKKQGIIHHQAKAVSIHPEGDSESSTPYVTIEYTDQSKIGQTAKVHYDYLINATGPKLNFGATKGLGPHDGYTHSVCTADHAVEANSALQELVQQMIKGDKKKFVIGTGHGSATCQGAAFEYIMNVDFVLRKAKVRDKAEITWLTNEYEIGDLGMGSMHIKRGGYITNTKVFTESIFAEREIGWITRAHVKEIEPKKIIYENLSGEIKEESYDFAMLIPPFAGVGLKAYDKANNDITSELFAPNGLMKVDADYTPKKFEEWKAADWPKYYNSPKYSNIFAVGIAFAPPHSISKPQFSPNGTPIFPTPPRTGMPSGTMARIVTFNVVDMIKGKADKPKHSASLTNMGAACIASVGSNLWNGSAASMTVYPIVPDFERFPETGRDLTYTNGEVGLAGHWIKYLLHYGFIYKAKANPFWFLIPE